MSNLDGKKILYIGPKFFDYETEITKYLKSKGAIVNYYDERGNPGKIRKVLIRKARFLVIFWIDSYYKAIINSLKPNYYNFVLVISPETIQKKHVLYLKKNQNNAIFVLYMWDSLKNKNAYSIIKYFDRKYSFDKSDCKKYALLFRPLFFLDVFIKKEIEYKTIDYCFIGSIHSDRYLVLKKIIKYFKRYQLTGFLFLFFPSKIIFLTRKVFDYSFWGINKNDFSFKPIDKEEVSKKISMSKVIIDIQHPKQLGLTLRTIEALGLHCKIITTNEDIVNYDFYSPSNILVINRNFPIIPINFINEPYRIIPQEQLLKYNLENWLKDLLFN